MYFRGVISEMVIQEGASSKICNILTKIQTVLLWTALSVLRVIRGSHQLKPLSEGITECLRKSIHISKDDVEWEGELFHV